MPTVRVLSFQRCVIQDYVIIQTTFSNQRLVQRTNASMTETVQTSPATHNGSETKAANPWIEIYSLIIPRINVVPFPATDLNDSHSIEQTTTHWGEHEPERYSDDEHNDNELEEQEKRRILKLLPTVR